MKLRFASVLGMGLIALFLAGCATTPNGVSIKWAEFDGDQEVWPTQPIGLMHARDGFPIYHLNQCPPHAYEVLGYIRTVKMASANGADYESAVVRLAQNHGSDAVLISRETTPSSFSSSYGTDYLAVKFKPRPAATAIENIDTFLSLTANAANGYDGPDFRGVQVHWTPEQLAAERKELLEMKAHLLAMPEVQQAR